LAMGFHDDVAVIDRYGGFGAVMVEIPARTQDQLRSITTYDISVSAVHLSDVIPEGVIPVSLMRLDYHFKVVHSNGGIVPGIVELAQVAGSKDHAFKDLDRRISEDACGATYHRNVSSPHGNPGRIAIDDTLRWVKMYPLGGGWSRIQTGCQTQGEQ